MENQTNLEFFNAEWNRRESLINDLEFRKVAVKIVKKMGISAKEWNENKMLILMHLANEFCSLENKKNK